MTSSAAIPFRKMNGLGNEIVVIDLRGSAKVFTAAEARAIAARPRSHFDQLMVLHDPETRGTDAFVRIYNTDGSSSDACGNGARCIGWLVARETGRRRLRFQTGADVLDVEVGTVDRITVDMGTPRFGWHEIPLAWPAVDTRAVDLQAGPAGKPLGSAAAAAEGKPPVARHGGTKGKPVLQRPAVVNMGNPHAVFWVEDVITYDLERFGPELETHPIFPERANISLAQITARDAIMLRTWERGAGLTRACGSAACAAVVCAARSDRTDRNVKVTLPGGTLQIEWTAADRVLMTGPVAFDYDGWIDAETLAPAAL